MKKILANFMSEKNVRLSASLLYLKRVIRMIYRRKIDMQVCLALKFKDINKKSKI